MFPRLAYFLTVRNKSLTTSFDLNISTAVWVDLHSDNNIMSILCVYVCMYNIGVLYTVGSPMYTRNYVDVCAYFVFYIGRYNRQYSHLTVAIHKKTTIQERRTKKGKCRLTCMILFSFVRNVAGFKLMAN